MFEDGLNSQEESKTNHLINRFNEMLESGQFLTLTLTKSKKSLIIIFRMLTKLKL